MSDEQNESASTTTPSTESEWKSIEEQLRAGMVGDGPIPEGARVMAIEVHAKHVARLEELVHSYTRRSPKFVQQGAETVIEEARKEMMATGVVISAAILDVSDEEVTPEVAAFVENRQRLLHAFARQLSPEIMRTPREDDE